MASTAAQPHSTFPPRPYSSTLHGKLPERNAPAFGASHPASRENARLERERQDRERAQREAAQAGPSNPLAQITDEQREKINEAVHISLPHKPENQILIAEYTVWALRPRQRPKDRLPRIQSRPQSPRLRPPQIRNPRPPHPARHPARLGRSPTTILSSGSKPSALSSATARPPRPVSVDVTSIPDCGFEADQ